MGRWALAQMRILNVYAESWVTHAPHIGPAATKLFSRPHLELGPRGSHRPVHLFNINIKQQECCHLFQFQIDKDSSSRNGKLLSAILWEKSWKSLFLQQQLGWDFEVGMTPHPMHSSMSVYFGHARVNPSGDMHSSCFMVEYTQLLFVWGYFSWLLTLGCALLFKKNGGSVGRFVFVCQCLDIKACTE